MHSWLSELSDRFSCQEDDLVRKFEESAKVQISNLELCISQLSEKLADLKGDQTETSSKSDQSIVTTQLSTLESSLKHITEKLNNSPEARSSEEESMKSQLAEIHSCIVQLMEEVTTKDTLLLDQNAQVSEIHSCVSQISENIMNTKSENTDLEHKIDQLNISTSQLTGKLKMWDAQFVEQNEQVSEIQSCMSEMSDTLKTLVASSPKDLVSNAQISEIHSCLNDLTINLKSRDAQVEKQNVQVSEIHTSMSLLTEKVLDALIKPKDQSLMVQVNAVHSAITDLSEKLLLQETKLNKQNSQVGKIHSSISEIAENWKDLDSKIMELNMKAELKKLASCLAQSMREAKTQGILLNRHSTELSEMHSCVAQLQEILMSRKEEMDLRTQLIDIQSCISQLPHLVMDTSENVSLKHQLSEVHSSMSYLLKELKAQGMQQNINKDVSKIHSSITKLQQQFLTSAPNNVRLMNKVDEMHSFMSQLEEGLQNQGTLAEEQKCLKSEVAEIHSFMLQLMQQLKLQYDEPNLISQVEMILSYVSKMPELLSENFSLKNKIEEILSSMSYVVEVMNGKDTKINDISLSSKVTEIHSCMSQLVEGIKTRDGVYDEESLKSKIMEIHSGVHHLMEGMSDKNTQITDLSLMTQVNEIHSNMSQIMEDIKTRDDLECGEMSLKSKITEIYSYMPQIMEGLKTVSVQQSSQAIASGESAELMKIQLENGKGEDGEYALTQLTEERQRRQRAELLLDEAQGKLDQLEASYERSSELDMLNARVAQLAEGVAREQKNVLRLSRGRSMLLRQLQALKTTLAEERVGHGSSTAQLSARIRAHHRDKKQLQARLIRVHTRYRRRIASAQRTLGSRTAKVEHLRAAMLKLGELCHSIERGYQMMLRELGQHILAVADLLAPAPLQSLQVTEFPDEPSQVGMWFVHIRAVAVWIQETLCNHPALPTVVWSSTRIPNDHVVLTEIHTSKYQSEIYTETVDPTTKNEKVCSLKTQKENEVMNTPISHYDLLKDWDKLVKPGANTESKYTKDLNCQRTEDKTKTTPNIQPKQSSKLSSTNSDLKNSTTLDFTSSLNSYLTVKDLRKETLMNTKVKHKHSMTVSGDELSGYSVGTLDTAISAQESSDTANIIASSLSEDVVNGGKAEDFVAQDDQRFLQNRFVAILEGLKQKLLQIDPINDLNGECYKNDASVSNTGSGQNN